MSLASVAGLARDTIGKKIRSLDRGSDQEWKDGPPLLLEDDRRFRAAADYADRRYDAAMKLAKDRARLAIGGVVIAVAMAGGWWLESQQPMVETVFVPFDRIGDPGEIFVAKASEPPDLMKLAWAEIIVKAMFGLSSDGNVNTSAQVDQDNVLRGQAREVFDRWAKMAADTADARQVAIVSSKQKSENVINVIWDEFDWKDGHMVASRRLNGDFTFLFVPPKTTGDVVRNKTGLFLTEMVFAEERR